MPELDPLTRETLSFVQPWLPEPARILEVGCGDGRLAARLRSSGHRVVALDRAPSAAAEDSGEDAVIVKDFLEYEDPSQDVDGPFDALLFTRSLHHVHPLTEALQRAWSLLRPGGLLIADEFACERMDHPTAEWLYHLRAVLEACGCLCPEGAAPGGPLERWRAQHYHEPPLNEGDAMSREIRERFATVSERPVAYLYRYAYRWLETEPLASRVALQVLEMEAGLLRRRAIRALGLQVVARKEE
jgi:SAM-dependent methyltransferase